MESPATTFLSLQEARKLALAQQGLLSAKPSFGRGKKGVLKAIEHLGYIQIDAISVIQRAHHHTLWSRVPGYQPQFLHKLLSKDRQIFEYWSHAASFLPMRDYRFAIPVMKSMRTRGQHWYHVDQSLKQQVFQKIREEGPLYARDFETPKLDPGIMWNWKPAKKALHELFMEGKITVKSRNGFQRLYDTTERCIPPHIDTAPPSYKDYLWHCIESSIRAHGLVTVGEIGYQKTPSNKHLKEVLKENITSGRLAPLQVKGLRSLYFSLPEVLENMPGRVSKQVHFLSPFDNAVIQRRRLKELFDFNYQTEIYYPVHKRVYGYFSLPILYGTRFIGRMDPKAHRDGKVLEIKNMVLEPYVKVNDQLIVKLREKLHEFAAFNECDKIVFVNTRPAVLKTALK